MRSRHPVRLAVLAAAALSLAACGGDIAPTTSAVATPTRSPLDPGSPDPSASSPLTDPELAIGCGDPAVTFPASALAGPAGAETGFDEAAAALREIVSTAPPESRLPPTGWFRVVDTPDRVLFVAPALAPAAGEPPWVQVAVARFPGIAGWSLETVGSCPAEVIMAAGLGRADWWLDPAAGPPDPAATSFPVLLRERACANGRPPVGRIVGPVVFGTPTAVTAVYATRQLPAADCPGNPAVPLTLELDEPLGDRQLLDGGTVPPRDASIPPG